MKNAFDKQAFIAIENVCNSSLQFRQNRKIPANSTFIFVALYSMCNSDRSYVSIVLLLNSKPK